MTTLTNPADLLSRVLLHHAQLFRGLSLGYMHRALHEVDTESRARAESMADAYEIVATTLEASAKVEALPEREEAPASRQDGSGASPDLSPRSESAPDWKPAKRIKDPETVQAQHVWGAHCLLCGNTPVSVHHLLSRSLGGDDVSENLVLLCGDGTRGCHGFVERHDRDVCRLLRVSLSPEQIDYLVGKKSWDWLDNRYPETVA